MLKRVLIVLMIISALFIAACGGGEGPKGPQKVFQPDWYGLNTNPDYVFAYGKAERVNENVAFDAASSNAFFEAAQYVETYVKGMVKNYVEEAGVENPQVTQLTSKVIKNVASAKFSQAQISKRETYKIETKFKVFVRLSIPKSVINQNLVDQIKNEEALYNRFKASQRFKELEEATE